jgi:3-oxoacyl-[acyl-carrier protein] reductase
VTTAADRQAWVVVAGGGGSLGRALVEHFAAARPVLCLDRDPAGFRDRQGVINRQIDLLDSAAIQKALDEVIPSSDRIAVLVNAVGRIWNEPVISLRGARFRAHDLDTWRQVIDANLTAPFAVASLVAMRMARSGGGSIVFFSSISSHGNPGQAAYSAAKAGIEGLTRTMAAELGPMKIRVNAVAPGFFDVPSTRAALTDVQLASLETRTPLKRLGQVSELVAAVDALASNEFVSGTIFDLTGGLRL